MAFIKKKKKKESNCSSRSSGSQMSMRSGGGGVGIGGWESGRRTPKQYVVGLFSGVTIIDN